MLRSLMQLMRSKVEAIDGGIGYVVNFLLDDQKWAIRYMVAQTDAPATQDGRRVLIAPSSFLKADWTGKAFHVALTKERINGSPRLDTDKPVTREQERAFHRYHGITSYWDDHRMDESKSATDVRLRSAEEIVGYHVQGTDGPIGHVDDFIIDDETWQVRYLVISTRNWWFGKKVLVAPHWATSIGWEDGKVYIDRPRQEIKDSPEWEPSAPVNREYEARLYDYYGRPVYWSGDREPVPAPPPAVDRVG